MVNQKTKGQHYVTEAYLRSFSASGKLYCFRKPDRSFFESSPEKVCKKRYLYEIELPNHSEDEAKEFVALNLTESVLSYIEGECMASLNRLDEYVNGEIERPDSLRDDVGKIAVFAVHLLFRNPKMLEATRKPIAERIHDTLKEMLHRGGGPSDDLIPWAYEAANWETLIKWDEGTPQSNLTIELLTMGRVFLRDTTGRLITSCAPIQIRPVGEPDYLTLYFPMTPRTAVLFVPREDVPTVFSIDVPDEVVMFFNSYYFSDESIAETCIASSYELLRDYVR